MAVTSFPNGTDDAITEAAWQGMEDARQGGGAFRVSGYDLSDAGGGTIQAAAGEAYIDGARVANDAAITEALDNGTRYVWLTKAGALSETATTTPATATDLYLCTATVVAGSITGIDGEPPVGVGVGDFTVCEMGASVSAGSTNAIVAQVDLAPGLWFATGTVLLQGSALSGGQSATVKLEAISGATVSDLTNTAWGDSHSSAAVFAVTLTVTTTANNDAHPVTFRGVIDIPDGGSIGVRATTSSHHTVTAGSPITFYRIK